MKEINKESRVRRTLRRSNPGPSRTRSSVPTTAGYAAARDRYQFRSAKRTGFSQDEQHSCRPSHAEKDGSTVDDQNDDDEVADDMD